MDNRIREARKDYASKHGKFTQEDAARYFGVSVSTYQKWEQGQGMMNGSQLRALAEKYETTVDYLIMAVDPPKQEKPAPMRGEAELLWYYRSMNAEGRSALLDQAEFLAARHPLNQDAAKGA